MAKILQLFTLALIGAGANALADPGAVSSLPSNSRSTTGPPVEWVRLPEPAEIWRFYPDLAARKEMDGRVTLACEITSRGGLTSCVIAGEEPRTMKFGAAAIQMVRAGLFQLRLNDPRAAGARINIPIVFRHQPAPTETPAAAPTPSTNRNSM